MGLCKRGGAFQRKFPYFPADQGISDSGDAFAVASQHSHPVAGFRLSPDTNQSVTKKPELRHQLAVFLSDPTPESASQQKKAASLPIYPFWAFSGVTLAEMQMVAPPYPRATSIILGPHPASGFMRYETHKACVFVTTTLIGIKRDAAMRLGSQDRCAAIHDKPCI